MRRGRDVRRMRPGNEAWEARERRKANEADARERREARGERVETRERGLEAKGERARGEGREN